MKKIFFTYLFTLLIVFSGYSQVENDSIREITTNENRTPINETAEVDTIPLEVISEGGEFKPDPLRSVWLGAVIPGYGQIVNKKYWKLPIVYGGFLGFAYAITWNNNKYTSYKNGYRDIIDDDPNTTYHIKMLPRGYTLENYPGGPETYKQRLKTGMNFYRKYRDLSIILAVAYYGIVLLEAYVDAELYDFDISPDLTLDVQPSKFNLEHYSTNNGVPSAVYGLQCSIRF